jgi:hypothetical protein
MIELLCLNYQDTELPERRVDMSFVYATTHQCMPCEKDDDMAKLSTLHPLHSLPDK